MSGSLRPARVSPAGYCPEGHCTFSLLPDCLAARLSGTLPEVEAVIDQVEQARTLAAAADRLRLDIELPWVLCWTRRRVKPVHCALRVLKGLMPDRFAGCEPTISAFRQQVAVYGVLPALRDIAATHLPVLPPPLGFRIPLPRGR